MISGRVAFGHAMPAKQSETFDVSETEFRLASSQLDLFNAFQLLQRRYIASGLSQSKLPIRVEPFHLSSKAQVLVAVKRDRVIGCLTLVRAGSRAGLPLERSYPKILTELPVGARVAEVTSLAIDGELTSHSSLIFIGLTQLAQRFALSVNVDHIVAVVHPSRARFYGRAIGFRVIGNELPCSRVEGNPGVVLVGKVDGAALCRPQWQNRFSAPRGRDCELRPRPMTPREREFFARYVTGHQHDRIAA
jgi:hypothetical protein